MSKSKVAVIKSSPQTAVEDVMKVMKLAGAPDVLKTSAEVALKINITWHLYMPGCSTTPWQLDGAIRQLKEQGFRTDQMHGVHNDTVVVDARVGEPNNHLTKILDQNNIRREYLNDPGKEWFVYEPKGKMLVLHDVFKKNGIRLPRFLVGKNIIHFPTVKTHVFTEMTGAMKNAFGGLLHFDRHWTHSVIHETLVDLLTIQKEIHPGVFAVMDGVFCGDGPGPRAIVPHVKGYFLASADQVAIDATSARLMGFDPLSIKFLKLAHDAGLGKADPREIEIVGDSIEGVNFGFHRHQETLASRGQKMIYHGPLKPLENVLLRSPITPWSFAASRLFHDVYWYPTHKERVNSVLRTEWGKLWESYG